MIEDSRNSASIQMIPSVDRSDNQNQQRPINIFNNNNIITINMAPRDINATAYKGLKQFAHRKNKTAQFVNLFQG